MPVFALQEELIFPPPDFAEPDGLLAVGGDLSPQRILLAYSAGIFPWYSEDSPILWWSPDPRLVLFPRELKISRSMRQLLRKEVFRVTFDRAFEEVIKSCASERRKDGEGTWLTEEMIDAYCGLHKMGYAHSVESWCGDELAGGLYGISMGKVFFGESMFAKKSNASKAAFVTAVEKMKTEGCELIDCQVTTAHLRSFGAREITREEFRDLLRRHIAAPALIADDLRKKAVK
ncbi:MAG: leucyl/phenylalanyl-tRNA--protein transferase [Nitrospiraceae bacterium]|nr:leucyl/phenylalanyl-tRNA--protein transferase [Nitrospiraceae bacterium]